MLAWGVVNSEAGLNHPSTDFVMMKELYMSTINLDIYLLILRSCQSGCNTCMWIQFSSILEKFYVAIIKWTNWRCCSLLIILIKKIWSHKSSYILCVWLTLWFSCACIEIYIPSAGINWVFLLPRFVALKPPAQTLEALRIGNKSAFSDFHELR